MYFHRALICLMILVAGLSQSSANPDAKRLYDDLLSSYNKLVRPVLNDSEAVRVRIKIKLSQLIDVNLKNQIMTTNLWVEQSWYDYKLQWNPADYGGVDMLNIPSDNIWRPDIVLYNNADGNFEVTLSTKATMYHTGLIEWKPPAIYKSSCEIDVEYFPFDEQTCVLKFGSWTYDGNQVDLRHLDEENGSATVEIGVDLSEFYMSVEWDILAAPATRNIKYYNCCDEPYLDITFNITMRRKTLFYTVNLIIPCMGITFLTVLVFYLPSDSGEKVSLAISILLSLTVFFLLLAEIIPPTSLVVPLLGKFVLFTMILDTFSICVTVVVLNIHFRSPQTHTMSPWVRRVFIHILPRLLIMRRPQYSSNLFSPRFPSFIRFRNCNGGFDMGESLTWDCNDMYSCRSLTYVLDSSADLNTSRSTREETLSRDFGGSLLNGRCKLHGMQRSVDDATTPDEDVLQSDDPDLDGSLPAPVPEVAVCPDVYAALDGIRFLAEHTKREQYTIRVREDWKYVATVLDRLFLWIFTTAVSLGTAAIILQAPTLYDDRIPIDVQFSQTFLRAFKKIPDV